MELRQLNYFVTVASALNFSKAAKKLFITQGTLSQQIQQLENELGSELFTRTSRSVALTEAGAQLLPLAKRTLRDSNDCKLQANDLRKAITGTLKIGVTHSFTRLLTRTLEDFMDKYKGVNLKIFYKSASELHDMLRGGELDLIVAFTPAVRDSAIISEPLFQSNLSAIMRHDHPLAGRKSVTVKEISRYGIALAGSGLQARKAFERFIDVDTSGLDVRVELNEPYVILDMVERSNMVAILSSLAIYYNKSLIAKPVQGIHRKMTGGIHYLRDAYRKRSAELFCQMLRESAEMKF